jgi:hypothetical protein
VKKPKTAEGLLKLNFDHLPPLISRCEETAYAQREMGIYAPPVIDSPVKSSLPPKLITGVTSVPFFLACLERKLTRILLSAAAVADQEEESWLAMYVKKKKEATGGFDLTLASCYLALSLHGWLAGCVGRESCCAPGVAPA